MNLQEVVPDRAHPDRAIWGFGPIHPYKDKNTDGHPSRIHLLRGDQWLEDGQAEGCAVADREQLARALELADLLQKKLQPLLRPSFYLEASRWIGELLKAPRAEAYSPPEAARAAIWVDPLNWEIMGTETPMEGRAVLLGAPGFPWPGDLWRVPGEPLGIPSEEALRRHAISAEDAALSAAAWHFGRVLYRKALPGRPDSLGCRGLERLRDLRQLLEELDVLQPEGLRTHPVGDLPVTPMATTEVSMVTTKALIRKDRWEEAEDGRGRYIHSPPSNANGYRRWEITLREGEADFGFSSMAHCQKVLEKGGLEMAALHGLLCCLVMQQEDPGSRFEVNGEDLLEDLGYGRPRGGKEGSTRSDYLKKLAMTAWLLDGVQCEGTARNYQTGERIEMARGGRIWTIEYRTVGEAQLNLPMESQQETSGTITDLRLIVTPGTWVGAQRSRKGDHLLYVPFDPRILQLGRYKQELAYRIGLLLGMEARIRWRSGQAHVEVQKLLKEAGFGEVVEKALQDRRSAHVLRQKWDAALVTLQQVVGFRFEFPPEHYPEALIPEDLRPAEMGQPGPTPPKALEQLLASRLVIHFPETVATSLRKALPHQERKALPRTRPENRQERTEQQRRPNSVRLKEALEQAKASGAITGRRQVAERLGMSVGQLSKLENGHYPLPERELKRCLALLETLRPKAQR
ncbi:MAG: helix-turn-helix domain-containing protein [Synechococcus sp.]